MTFRSGSTPDRTTGTGAATAPAGGPSASTPDPPGRRQATTHPRCTGRPGPTTPRPTATGRDGSPPPPIGVSVPTTPGPITRPTRAPTWTPPHVAPDHPP